MSPTVQKGSERVRVCLHAGNTVEEIEGLVRCVGEWIGTMDKKGEIQAGGVEGRYSSRGSGLGVGSEEENIAGVGVSLKGDKAIEKAKL